MTHILGNSSSTNPTQNPVASTEDSGLSRRRFLGLTAGFGAAATLMGGGVASAAKTAAKAAAPAKATGRYAKVKAATEITYWSAHPAKSKPVEEILLKRFSEANPNIKVNLQTAGANYAEIAQKFNAADRKSVV